MDVVKSNIVLAPFQFWPPGESWGIHWLVVFSHDMQWAITQALRNAAVALQEEIAAHKGSAKTTISKQYERDSERAIEVLKHVQLFRLNCNKNLMATRLATCPLQLGYADMDQWNRSRDLLRSPDRDHWPRGRSETAVPLRTDFLEASACSAGCCHASGARG